VKVNDDVALVLLLAGPSLLCCAGEQLRQCPNLFAVKYVILLKHRKYPIDDKIFTDAEVCLWHTLCIVVDTVF